MDQNDIKIMTHTRLVTYTKPLEKFLLNLGYVVHEECGYHYPDKITIYKYQPDPKTSKGTKFVEVRFQYLELYIIEGGKRVRFYKGVTVHDELLEFFTKRNIISNKISFKQ